MSAAFDSLALRAVTLELERTVLGAQVQKVRQPDPFTILLRLHGAGVSRWLLLSAHPDLFRTHLTSRRYPNPQEPPPFCMALRKYLEGGRVTGVWQDGADRVLHVEVSSTWGRLQLVAELMGRHSNIVLLAEEGTVLEAIKHIGARMSRRVIFPGRPYPALPAAGKPSLWDAPWTELASMWETAPDPITRDWLLATYGGMSPALAKRVLSAADALVTLGEIVAAVRSGEVSISASERLDADYAERSTTAGRDVLLRTASGLLDREARTIERRRADLDAMERRAVMADEWRIAGELLLASAHAIQKGATSVSLPNYYNTDLAPMEIALEPTLSPRENADAYFVRQRKAKAAAQRVPELRRELANKAVVLEERRRSLAEADEEQLQRMMAELSGPAPSAVRKTGKAESEYPPGVRIKRITSEEGWQILVGENATGNDYLTTRLADPGDIWLHVRAAASAHGVIRTNKHAEKVPPSVLRRAAEMVAARSEARHSSVIAVDYTLRRYVRKPRGAAPGRVTYSNEKTIEVEPKADG